MFTTFPASNTITINTSPSPAVLKNFPITKNKSLLTTTNNSAITKTATNNTTTTNTSSPSNTISDLPTGGNVWDCLSATELDQVLKATTPESLSAFTFFNFRVGTLEESAFTSMVDTHLDRFPRGIFIPLHICHHWLLLFLRREGPRRKGTILDSAPSPIVKKKISKLLSPLTNDLTFPPGMRQLRESNECGLFLLVNTLRLQRNLPCTAPPLPHSHSLAHFRSLLAQRDVPGFVEMAVSDSFPLLVGGDWGGELSNDDIDATLTALALPSIPATFTINREAGLRHWKGARRTEEIIGIPVWVPRHWIGGASKGGDIYFFDSAPKPENTPVLLGIADSLLPGGRAFRSKAPRQPIGSNQCGIHTIVNIILFYFNIILSGDQFPCLDLDRFRMAGVTSLHQVMSIFSPVPTDPSSLALGDKVIHLLNGSWQVLDLTARRRGMTMGKGVVVSIPPNPVEARLGWCV